MEWLLKPPVFFPDFWLTLGVGIGAVVVIVAGTRTVIDLIRHYWRRDNP